MVSFNHMIEYTVKLDYIFSSLADSTRRDILRRVAKKELSVGAIAKSYSISFAAVSKHLGVLERANLIVKHRCGKQHYARLAPVALKDANAYLEYLVRQVGSPHLRPTSQGGRVGAG